MERASKRLPGKDVEYQNDLTIINGQTKTDLLNMIG
jgi:hypothetical protein